MSDIPNLKHRNWILAALMSTVMLAALDITIVSTAIPQIVRDLGGFSIFSWIYSSYLLAQTVTIPIYGKLADLYGRKPVLIAGTVIFLIGSAASALSWNMLSLIVFRGLQGLGAGSISATVNTIAGDIYSVKERAKIQGWISSVWGVTAIIGPALGGAFAEYANWRWIFLINIPVGILAIILLLVFLKESIIRKKHHIDYQGAVFILLSGLTLIYTLMQLGQEWSVLSPEGFSMIVVSFILIFITIRIESRSIEPIMPGWVWKNRILTGVNLAILGMGTMMLGPSMYLPVYAQSVLGMGAIGAGFVLASLSLGWPLASSYSGRLYLRIGFRNTALIGASLVVISSLVFLALPYQSSVWLLVSNQAILGAGFGLLSTPTLVGIQSMVNWNKRGVVTSSNVFSRFLGQSIGAALLGGVFNFAILKQLKEAPEALKPSLPDSVNDVINAIQPTGAASTSVEYLRHSFFEATQHVYLVMGAIGVFSLTCLLMLPASFPAIEDN